jgi:hypothetical protein
VEIVELEHVEEKIKIAEEGMESVLEERNKALEKCRRDKFDRLKK